MADLYDDDEDDSGQWVNVHTPEGAISMTPRRARRYAEEVDAAHAPLSPPVPDDAGQWTGVTMPGGKVYMPPEKAARYADGVDAQHEAQRAEDDALAELAGSMDYAGIGKPTPVPVPAIGVGTGNRPRPRGDSPADVDALGATWDDFYNRANEVNVERVPSAVPLASRMGGEPLPRPAQRSAVASPPPGPQQGPVFGESDTLQDAQKRATLMRGLSGIGKGMSKIGGAIAGVRLEDGASADMEQAAGAKVRDYLQRKQQGEAEKASAQQAAQSDPTSPESQRFQAMVSRAFGSVYSPEQIKGMTAADAPLVGKYGEMVRTLEDRAAGRAAEAESQQAQLTARSTEAEKQRAFEGKQGAANRANAREIAGMRQGAATDSRIEAAELKQKQKIAERNVGGFEMEDPANPPSADGAKQMATVATARDKILSSLRRMEEDFNQSGTEWGGAAASRMEAEWKNVTDQMRMIADMGVPNGRDYEMLARQIPSPVGPGAMTTMNSTIGAKFPVLRQQVADMVNSTAKAYKFRPVGGDAAPRAATTPRRKRDTEGRVWEEQPDGSARLVL